MDNLLQNINRYLFDSDFYDSGNLFLMFHNELPDKIRMYGVDGVRASKTIRKEFAGKIRHMLESTGMNAGSRKEEFENGHFVMEGKLVIELGYNWCYIFYCAGSDHALLAEMKRKLIGIKRKPRQQPLEMNLIVMKKNGLELQRMEVKKSRLDVSLFYNDDFTQTDEIIRKRLNTNGDKGIVLLHGIPGTGKTTYLRWLVGRIKKRVMFVPPDVAARISNPELVQLLVDNPNSVLVIEDAEHIIMQRHAGGDSAVSTLLNISDGLLSDFLNVQVICTFNSAISAVDEALLRKGRLIARYEFGRLTVEKAQRLSRHLGFETVIAQPMTIAEIANQHEVETAKPARGLIGFRRQLVE